MSSVLICPSGHHWEISQDGLASEIAAPIVCPICGVLCPDNGGQNQNTGADPWATMPMARADTIDLPKVPGYEVIAWLGRGGMGTVYKARHSKLGRLVALKVLIADGATGMHLARFQTEAEALAKLKHPNIVQIYEVSEYAGTPYFSLELLEGGNLERKLAHVPQPPVETARLMETMTRAVHAAHQQGIIHRDLKPANILLTADGQPKISDFGIAKRLDDDVGQTKTGAIMGTPSYMAPEQASADQAAIGPCTDVYALGTILYEMLTGRPPFQSISTPDTLHMVCFSEPVPPRRLQPKVPRDLDTICMKCLEKQPVRRYASAGELADDLHRFLVQEPIRARRASSGERVVKWARRRPALAALIAVIVLSIVAIAGIGVGSNIQLRASAELAENRLRETRSAADDMYTGVAEEWLQDEPYKDPVRQKFLEKAVRLYQQFVNESGDDPAIRRETAQAHFRLGQIHRILSQTEAAEGDYARAIEVQRGLHAQFPHEPHYQQDLANSLNWLGELLREAGRPLDEAKSNYEAARTLQEDLVKRFPAEPVYRKELARSRYNLYVVQSDTGDRTAAADHLDRAMELTEQLHQDAPDNPEFRHELALCLINRGVLLRDLRSPDQAKADYQNAIGLLRPDRQLSGVRGRLRAIDRRDLGIAHQNLGNLLLSQGQFNEALDELGHAIVQFQRLVEDYPTRPTFQKYLANSFNSLASVYAGRKDLVNAEDNWHEARAILNQLVQTFPENGKYQMLLALTLSNYGWLRSENKDWSAARDYFEKATHYLQEALKRNPKNPECSDALCQQYRNLAEIYIQLNDHKKAAKAADALSQLFPDRAQDNYYAACFLARCVGLAEKDETIEPVVRQLYVVQYTEDAVFKLQSVVAKNDKDLKRLPNEQESFQAISHLPAVRESLAQLNKSASK